MCIDRSLLVTNISNSTSAGTYTTSLGLLASDKKGIHDGVVDKSQHIDSLLHSCSEILMNSIIIILEVLLEHNIFLFVWLVNSVYNKLEKLSDSLLILSTDITFCELKVNLSQVHSLGSWNESVKELVSEFHLDTVSLVSSC